MESTKFWSRVGHWFRKPGRAAGSDSGMPVPGGVGLTADDDSPGQATPVPPVARSHPGRAIRSRWAKPNPHLERLEAEYARVVNLIDAIEGHLASQAEQSRHIARSLERLAEGVSTLPESARQELELLTAINEAVSADLASTRRLEENLAQLPQLADSQREAIVSIDRRLDASREADERLNVTMSGVGQSMTKLSEVVDNSGKALQALRWDSNTRDEKMAALVEQQTKRFTLFAWSAMGLAGIAAVIGLVAVFR